MGSRCAHHLPHRESPSLPVAGAGARHFHRRGPLALPAVARGGSAHRVAGAIDLRGVIDSNRGPRLRVHTSNVPLIDAFVEIFDGERKIWTEAGTEVEILNRNYTLKRDRAAWELRGSAVKDFCAYVTPYLLRGKVKGIEKLI